MDIHRICRICLREKDILMNIFTEDAQLNCKLSTMISTCSNMKINKNDKLPNNICSKCVESARNAFIFRQQCDVAYHKLQSLLEHKPNEVQIDNIFENTKGTQTESEQVVHKFERDDDHNMENNGKDFLVEVEYLQDTADFAAEISNTDSTAETLPCKLEVFENLEYLSENLKEVVETIKAEPLVGYDCQADDSENPDDNRDESNASDHNDELSSNKNSKKIEGKHECEHCGKTFGRSTHLRRHLLIHTKEKPFTCKICAKPFSRSDHLAIHESTFHSQERSFACQLCEKTFKRAEHLRYHKVSKHNETTAAESHKKKHDSENLDENQDESNASDHNDEPSSNKNLNSGAKHKCEHCDKIFGRATHLRRHLLIHTKEKPFMCNICAKTFSRSDHLANHASTFHSQERSFACQLCEKTFKRFEDLRYHAESKHETTAAENKETCDICQKVFSTLEDLLSHKKNHDPENLDENQDESNASDHNDEPSSNKNPKKIGAKHKCEHCDKIFGRATHLRRHLLTHTKEKPFMCKICAKPFSRSDHLTIHESTFHSQERPFACQLCEKAFKRAEHLRNHVESKHNETTAAENKETCDICQKGFSSLKNLLLHKKKHTQQKVYSCKHCDKRFQNRIDYCNHLKQEHSQQRKQFLCADCGQSFVRNDYLRVHMRRHKGIKPYKCKFCPKAFPRATDLKVHEKYHTNEKAHLCNICGKGFHRAYNLLVHSRTHNGLKPYKCPHCTKCFAQGNDLKAHVRRHTGERYKCDLCGEGFIQAYQLNNHKRIVHNMETTAIARRVTKYITPTAQEQQVLLQQHHQQLEKLFAQKKVLEAQQKGWDIENIGSDVIMDRRILEIDERIHDVEQELEEINNSLHEELERQEELQHNRLLNMHMENNEYNPETDSSNLRNSIQHGAGFNTIK